MAYVFIENFKQGMDRRSSIDNAPVGSLWDLKNAHITRGGEVEIRKKFVSKYSLPAGVTFGLQETASALYVFGSTASPVIPSGITYQQLAHPQGFAMTELVDSDVFDGKVYAVARYSDDSVQHFYDGALVTDWNNGVVTAAMTNNSGIAAHLAGLITDSAYSVSVSTDTVTIEAAVAGTAFTIDSDVINVEGGTDDQTITISETQLNVPGVDEVLSSCSLQVVASKASAGVNKITSITINAVDVLGAAVDASDNPAITAASIASKINTYTSTPNYTALADSTTVLITADDGTGSGPNFYDVIVNVAGAVVVSTGGFNIAGGTANPGTNTLATVRVDGVNILGAAVDWTTDNSTTAAAVAAQINTYSSSPDYVASAAGPFVHISKLSVGDEPTPLALVTTVGGDVTVSDETGILSTVIDMAGGVDAIAGQAQINTAKVGGTFEIGDKFSIILDGDIYGALFMPSEKGNEVLTHQSKVYSLVGSILQYSGLNDPTLWNTDEDVGAGFINMSNQAAGSESLTAISTYQDSLALFSRKAIQIWYVAADDILNTPLKVLKNIGTRSPKSVVPFGDEDVFFLGAQGIRSLRARDSSNSAYVEDVGTSIDGFISTHLSTLTDSEIEDATGLIEPGSGRYWLAVGDKIFVFSYFPSSKISAWSYYESGFTISSMVNFNDRVYVRSNDTVYLYGGDDNATYHADDEIECVAQFPFFHAGQPADDKQVGGIDASLVNEWDVDVLVDPGDLTRYVRVGDLEGFTYNKPDTGAVGHVTHIAPKFICTKGGYAKIANVGVHYSIAEREVRG